MYTIKYHKQVVKHLERLPLIDKARIAQKIHQLGVNPTILDIKKYTKTEKSWRIRIGKIRIIYQKDDKNKLILIRRVGYRGDIYKH